MLFSSFVVAGDGTQCHGWRFEAGLPAVDPEGVLMDLQNLVFAVDEVPVVSRPSYLPPKFDRVVRLGRHRSVSMIYTAQRLSETARRLTAATDYFWLFAHEEPRDLDVISDRCGHDIADKVARLGLHDSLIYG